MPDNEAIIKAIDQIAALPADFSSLVEHLDDKTLDTPYSEGKWTVRQVVHHMADAHAVLYVRIKKLATEEGPELPSFDQDAWARTPDTEGPIEPSLALLKAVHERGAQLLRSLPDKASQRVGNHPVRSWTNPDGTVTLERMVLHWAWHGDRHLATLRDFLNKQ